jgi:RHS repeat-associated protein
VDCLFAFTGRMFDDDTGLQNNLNRWYDAAVGGWLSEDPIGFASNDTSLYRYVRNRPTTATDPCGTELITIAWTTYTIGSLMASSLAALYTCYQLTRCLHRAEELDARARRALGAQSCAYMNWVNAAKPGTECNGLLAGCVAAGAAVYISIVTSQPVIKCCVK